MHVACLWLKVLSMSRLGATEAVVPLLTESQTEVNHITRVWMNLESQSPFWLKVLVTGLLAGDAELRRSSPVPEVRLIRQAAGRRRQPAVVWGPGRRGVRAGGGAADGEQHDDGDAVPAEQGPVPHAHRAGVGDLGSEGVLRRRGPAGKWRRQGNAARREAPGKPDPREMKWSPWGAAHRCSAVPGIKAISSLDSPSPKFLTACALFLHDPLATCSHEMKPGPSLHVFHRKNVYDYFSS